MRDRRRVSTSVLAAASILSGCGGSGEAVPRLAASPAPTPAASAATRPAPSALPAPAAPAALPAPPPAPTVRLQDLLAARAGAHLARDRSAWLAVLDPADAPGRRAQARLFDTLAALPIGAWSYAVSGMAPSPTARDGSVRWLADVELRYRLAGYDTADVVRAQSWTLLATPGGWRLRPPETPAETPAETPGRNPAGDPAGAGAQPRDLWDLGPVSVLRGARSLVVAAGAGRDLRAHAAEADAAVARVTAGWGEAWARHVVVVVPATEVDMAVVLDGPVPGLHRVAAVATGQATGTRTTGNRVVLNPRTYPALSAAGRRVVLAHEITHVATRGSGAGELPMWLSEGFADYVGYAGSGIAPTAVAGTLLARVRAGTGPDRLPGRADFDATRGDVAAAYEAAWLACRLIAARHGEAALVAFYRAAAAGPAGGADAAGDPATDGRSPGSRAPAAVAAAFADVLGTSEAAFEAAWLSSLDALAGVG